MSKENKKAKPRNDELIGGGYFVFRRGKRTGRIGVSYKRVPFEHPDYAAAEKEANRLANENPGEIYQVFSPGTTICILPLPNSGRTSDDRT